MLVILSEPGRPLFFELELSIFNYLPGPGQTKYTVAVGRNVEHPVRATVLGKDVVDP